MAESLRDQLSAGLLRLRTAAGLSLAQLAQHTNLSRPALNFLERGKSGGVLDTMDRYIAGCRGQVVVITATRGEDARAELAQAIAEMPLGDVITLLRLVRARPELPDMEWKLLADATELRVRALRESAPAANVVQLPR